jgi:hypothetical protein
MQEIYQGWQLIKGKNPLLLTAGHNFPQIRKGKFKPRDVNTGKLVRRLARKTNSWGLVSTRVQLDPNWYERAPFRIKVKQIIAKQKIKCVVDLHGKNLGAEDLLTVYANKTFKNNFSRLIKDFKKKEFIDDQQLTLAESLDQQRIFALQIEIRKDGRVKTIANNQCSFVEKAMEKLIRQSVKNFV